MQKEKREEEHRLEIDTPRESWTAIETRVNHYCTYIYFRSSLCDSAHWFSEA